MFITIRGKQGTGKTAVAEALRDYFSYRGVACIIYDYLQPIREVVDVTNIIFANYGCAYDDVVRPSLISSLYATFAVKCLRIATTRVKELTSRWDELKLHYIVIIDSAPGEVLPSNFTGFMLGLTCSKDVRRKRITGLMELSEENILEVGLNDCAESNIFDLVVDTSETSPKDVATLVGDKIHDKMKTLFL